MKEWERDGQVLLRGHAGKVSMRSTALRAISSGALGGKEAYVGSMGGQGKRAGEWTAQKQDSISTRAQPGVGSREPKPSGRDWPPLFSEGPSRSGRGLQAGGRRGI